MGGDTVDAIDKQILSLLTNNARLPLKQIAAQVFLSSPAVAARIQRLEQEGIITGYHASVDQEKLGNRITAFIQLVLPPESKQHFADFLRVSPFVLECWHVTGPYSMLMKACFADTAQMEAFVAKLQCYGTTQTQIVFSSVKEESGRS